MSGSARKDPPNNNPKKIRCLVIQLARLGDTLQSLMALRAAKQLYPQLEIHFVARERFADAAKRVPWIEQIITLPTEELIGPVLSGAKDLKQTMGPLARWVAPLVQEPWDLILNWSYSDASSYLTGLLPARVKLGYSRRDDLSFVSPDGWSHFIQAIVQGKVEQNIHLTDILTTQLLTALQIHAGDPADEGNAPVTSKGFFALSLDESYFRHGLQDSSKRWIGIQLSGSNPSKNWNPEQWAQVASLILARHPDCGIVLLGTAQDKNREERFLAHLKRNVSSMKHVISLVGQCSFDLWASVVGKCQWVLAGDTAVLHLASVLGTRTINVSLGSPRLSETGAYGNGHYVISEEKPPGADPQAIANSGITPEAVYGTWAYASSEWSHRRQLEIDTHFAQLGWADQLPLLKIHRSRIRGTNDGGGVVFEPLIRRTLDLKEWSAQVMGHIARAWYCGWMPPIAHEVARTMINPSLIQDVRKLEESILVLNQICDEAKKTAIQLSAKSSRLKSNRIMSVKDREDIAELGRKLNELDQLMERLVTVEPAIAGFARMAKVLMSNLSGSELTVLGRQSADCYHQLSQGISLYREWIKETIALARPVAVANITKLSREAIKRRTGKELTP